MESDKKNVLDAILEGEMEEFPDISPDGDLKNENQKEITEGLCVECEEQLADGICDQCKDDLCKDCFSILHRKGLRKEHNFLYLNIKKKKKTSENDEEDQFVQSNMEIKQNSAPSMSLETKLGPEWFIERSRYIPLRLTYEERKWLRLVNASLNVSNYTDKVDVKSYGSPAKRMAAQLREICAILSGLIFSADYKRGQKLIKDKDFVQNAGYFREIFEIGRRYKIMNPEKMRSEYGKLIYMLQDSSTPHVQELLQFSCVRNLKTVYEYLKKRKALDLLEDKYVIMATQEILTEGKSRHTIRSEIKNKEKAQDYLARKYSNDKISADEIKLCLYSIGDNHSYLRGNRDPCDKMIKYLKKYFSPDSIESEEFSLAINLGKNGARLSHSHARQYHYVLQSLTLWREILHDMFKLWYLAEQDLLDTNNPYKLTDTGQGLNRVQPCPRISKAIHSILRLVQREVEWVGSSVVHLGDSNVPNALMFIDKYNQVSRILNPIILCLDKIEEINDNDELRTYIKALGGVDRVRKLILADFFTHGFDGSGADNFYDAGSCIDGRLTSAWNWCSKIETKKYFPVFLLTGFMGFDGQF